MESTANLFVELARRAVRPEPVRAPVGATVDELAALLAVDDSTLRPVYASAALFDPLPGSRALFSRAAVSEILSALNGRPIAYPTEPLLRLREVHALATLAGLKISRQALAWSAWRSTHPDHPKNCGDAPIVRATRVSAVAVRVTRQDAQAYLRAFAEYRGRS
jgi:hypothetical protein